MPIAARPEKNETNIVPSKMIVLSVLTSTFVAAETSDIHSELTVKNVATRFQITKAMERIIISELKNTNIGVIILVTTAQQFAMEDQLLVLIRESYW